VFRKKNSEVTRSFSQWNVVFSQSSRAHDVMSSDDVVVKRHSLTSSPSRIFVMDECHRCIRVLPAYRTERRRRHNRIDGGESVMSQNLRHVSYTSVLCSARTNERTNEVYLPMNGVNNDWLPVQAEAHQSWQPKKETDKLTNRERKRKKQNTLLYIK